MGHDLTANRMIEVGGSQGMWRDQGSFPSLRPRQIQTIAFAKYRRNERVHVDLSYTALGLASTAQRYIHGKWIYNRFEVLLRARFKVRVQAVEHFLARYEIGREVASMKHDAVARAFSGD